MKIIGRLLENIGIGQLLRGAMSQPSDLMATIRLIHERTFYKLTGKRPFPSTIITGMMTSPSTEGINSLSPFRKLVRREI